MGFKRLLIGATVTDGFIGRQSSVAIHVVKSFPYVWALAIGGKWVHRTGFIK